MKKLLQRLREPSTWASLSVLLVVFGLSDADSQVIANFGAAAAAFAGLFLKEKGEAEKASRKGW